MLPLVNSRRFDARRQRQRWSIPVDLTEAIPNCVGQLTPNLDCLLCSRHCASASAARTRSAGGVAAHAAAFARRITASHAGSVASIPLSPSEARRPSLKAPR
jgi:hypothetical protein